jgi:[ribosomal protein S5]-alanine N-acetyltransferase
MKPVNPPYVYIWEFEVAPHEQAAFLRAYGPAGTWSALFGKAGGYIGTLLLNDQRRPSRYLTIDRWRSAEAYADFLAAFRAEYEELDRLCERFTSHEASLGSYLEYLEPHAAPAAPALALAPTPALAPLPPVHTSRSVVRAVAEADLADLFEVNGDDEVTKFLPYSTWRTREDAADWLARMRALCAAGSAQQLVIERLADHKVIGTVLVFKHDASSARVELGYVVGRSCWRQGYAREALRAVCQHLFTAAGIRRIEAEVHPDNTASNELLLGLGFTREGLLRKRWVSKGVAYDTRFYGCLAEDWLQRSGAA